MGIWAKACGCPNRGRNGVGHLFDGIRVQRYKQAAWITLTRPSRLNSPDQLMAASLSDACGEIAADRSVLAVVITGDGDSFCEAMPGPFSPSSPGHTGGEHPLGMAQMLAALDIPVLAAINGPATGQGLEIALACDIRIASRTAVFSMPQILDGFLPWDGGTQRLPRIIGRSRAMELLVTGRRLDAEEAFRIGLIQEVVENIDLLDAAQGLADRICANAPIAIRYTKEAVLRGLDLRVEDGMQLEADLSFLLQSTSDRHEGIVSFLDRRPPRYRGQ